MRPGITSGRIDALVRAAALAGLAIAVASPSPAMSALRSVSGVPDPAVDPDALTEVFAGGPKGNVAYSLAHGFPLWYRDETGLTLELCLDQRTERVPGTFFFPCLTAEPFTQSPISFPTNFGLEAFYWMAATFGAFTSSVNGVPVPGSALLVMGLEAGFQTNLTVDGGQAVFSRIRLRIDAPLPGAYRVTHPYGEIIYFVSAAGTRVINQTQDVGNILAPAPAGPPPGGDFTLALRNGPSPGTLVPPIGFPAINGEIVSAVPTSLGPFLVPADPLERITVLNGSTYLTDPGTDLVPIDVPVTGGPNGNAFRIELLDPPPGVFLNSADQSQVIEFTEFQVSGKIFDEGPNVPPVANDDVAGTAPGEPVVIDVVANDDDPASALNVHGLNPQAIGLPSNGAILLTRELATAHGKVRRLTDFRTGKTTFVYTPDAGFEGSDTFQYVVQDRGGLVSAPATVTVTVEDLAIATADFRPRIGKWRIAGTSSDTSANTVVVSAGPRADLAPVPALSTAAGGSVTLRLTPTAIDYRLALDPLPSSDVDQVHLHVAVPGQGEPVVFELFHRLGGAAFSGTKRGTLTPFDQLFFGFGLNGFADVIEAILAGDAYVDVHTAANAGGELRGPLAAPVLGTAAVDAVTGDWAFTGKASTSPGGAPASVNALSGNGVRKLGTPLRFR